MFVVCVLQHCGGYEKMLTFLIQDCTSLSPTLKYIISLVFCFLSLILKALLDLRCNKRTTACSEIQS